MHSMRLLQFTLFQPKVCLIVSKELLFLALIMWLQNTSGSSSAISVSTLFMTFSITAFVGAKMDMRSSLTLYRSAPVSEMSALILWPPMPTSFFLLSTGTSMVALYVHGERGMREEGKGRRKKNEEMEVEREGGGEERTKKRERRERWEEEQEEEEEMKRGEREGEER